MKVMSMVRGFGEKAAVSQLSWSYHAIEAEMREQSAGCAMLWD